MAQQANDIHEWVTLVSCTCARCGIAFGMPKGYSDKRLEDHQYFYCPNGHSQYFPGQTEAERLQAELNVERQRSEWNRQKANRIERQMIALKGQVTRIKNRVAAGVCPCCNRTFQNLARHMHSKHPDFKK